MFENDSRTASGGARSRLPFGPSADNHGRPQSLLPCGWRVRRRVLVNRQGSRCHPGSRGPRCHRTPASLECETERTNCPRITPPGSTARPSLRNSWRQQSPSSATAGRPHGRQRPRGRSCRRSSARPAEEAWEGPDAEQVESSARSPAIRRGQTAELFALSSSAEPVRLVIPVERVVMEDDRRTVARAGRRSKFDQVPSIALAGTLRGILGRPSGDQRPRWA